MGNQRASRDDESSSQDFSLRLITPPGKRYGALLFVATTAQAAQSFLRKLVNVMFPPGGRSSSHLSVETRDGGILIYEVSSDAGRATIALTEVPREVGMLVRDTLQECSSLPLIFGFTQGSQIVLIEPAKNHVVRTSAFVDKDYIECSTARPFDWSNFFDAIAHDHLTVAAEVDS
jgi:hypothetical protein